MIDQAPVVALPLTRASLSIIAEGNAFWQTVIVLPTVAIGFWVILINRVAVAKPQVPTVFVVSLKVTVP